MVSAIVLAGLMALGGVDAGAPDGSVRPDAGTPTASERALHCPAGMAFIPARAHDREYAPTAVAPATHAFCMDILETTHADYEQCVRAGKCGRLTREGRWAKRPRYPVLHATFEQAIAYCEFRNKRLASPWEWIRAAGGDERRRNPWGNEWPLNMRGFCIHKGHPCEVGSSPRDVSQFGIRDMAFNAREWVRGILVGLDRSFGGYDWRHTANGTTAIIGPEAPGAGIRCAFAPLAR